MKPPPAHRRGPDLRLEQYDQTNFGFLRLEFSKTQILGTYISAPYSSPGEPQGTVVETFSVDLATHSVTTLAAPHARR
jgi:hypothetical protein